MHERDRHRLILSAAQDRTVVTVPELCDLTGASEATVRRDINALDEAGRLRRIRGGAEALAPRQFPGLAGRPLTLNQTRAQPQKTAIARAAVEMCADGEPIIINGGSTTFEMVHGLATRQLTVMTNALLIAQHLMTSSRNQVLMPGGVLYREQSIMLSSFQEDVTQHFWARRMFMSCAGIGPLGIHENDPLLVRAEEKLMARTDELVVLADASKFKGRASLVLCPLHRIHTVITDERVTDRAAAMIEAADVRLVTVPVPGVAEEGDARAG